MSRSDPDIEADSTAVTDRGESPAQMESMLLSEGSAHRPGLSDLAVGLAAASAGLRRSLPAGLLSALADRVDGKGGVICVDKSGGLGLAHNTSTMAYGFATLEKPSPVVGVQLA